MSSSRACALSLRGFRRRQYIRKARKKTKGRKKKKKVLKLVGCYWRRRPESCSFRVPFFFIFLVDAPTPLTFASFKSSFYLSPFFFFFLSHSNHTASKEKSDTHFGPPSFFFFTSSSLFCGCSYTYTAYLYMYTLASFSFHHFFSIYSWWLPCSFPLSSSF